MSRMLLVAIRLAVAGVLTPAGLGRRVRPTRARGEAPVIFRASRRP